MNALPRNVVAKEVPLARRFTKGAAGALSAMLTVSFVWLAAFSASAAPAPKLSRYAWVYEGAEGVKVIVVRVGDRSEGTVLMQIDGVDHPLDGKIILHKVTKKHGNKRAIEYSMPGLKKPWVTLVANGHIPGRRQFFLFLPDEATYRGTPEHGRALVYNKASSAAIDPRAFLQAYERFHKGRAQ